MGGEARIADQVGALHLIGNAGSNDEVVVCAAVAGRYIRCVDHSPTFLKPARCDEVGGRAVAISTNYPRPHETG